MRIKQLMMQLTIGIVAIVFILAMACGPKPEEKTVSKPPPVTPVGKAVEKPSDKPAETPVVKPVEKPVEKPADKPAAAPVVAPAEKTPEKPVEKPAESPAGKTVSFDALKAAGVGVNTYTTAMPGTTSPLPRAYPGAPPQIPHDISAFAITAKSNPCTGCHQAGMELSPGHKATKIPQSHYTDLATGKTTPGLEGARYYCINCHVPQSAGAPPVANK